MPTTSARKGICFVISPIGNEGTETRGRADRVFKHIIEPVVRESGYEAVRADQVSKPGIITSQIIQHLMEDPLVIADLAGHNPNVFYELAIRHMTRKPVIQITQVGEPIPFDLASTRAIQLDHRDLESAELCKQSLAKQIRGVEEGTSDFDNPFSIAIDLQQLQQSSVPAGRRKASTPVASVSGSPRSQSERPKVFIIHGRDEALKSQLARLVEMLRLTAVILHEQANKGRTIIEKLERTSDIAFAVALLTPDDVGGSAGKSTLRPRTRQNVMFELGHFENKLGRDKVCILYTPGIELPSDLGGIAYIEIDSGGAWQYKLAKELRSAGIEADLNLIT